MARDPGIDNMLQRWAERVTVGNGSGFPTMSTLHPSWQPPPPGQMPTMRTFKGDDYGEAAQMHRLVARLSTKQFNAVVAHYLLHVPMAEQAKRLGCGERTVIERVERAQRELRAWLSGDRH